MRAETNCMSSKERNRTRHYPRLRGSQLLRHRTWPEGHTLNGAAHSRHAGWQRCTEYLWGNSTQGQSISALSPVCTQMRRVVPWAWSRIPVEPGHAALCYPEGKEMRIGCHWNLEEDGGERRRGRGGCRRKTSSARLGFTKERGRQAPILTLFPPSSLQPVHPQMCVFAFLPFLEPARVQKLTPSHPDHCCHPLPPLTSLWAAARVSLPAPLSSHPREDHP